MRPEDEGDERIIRRGVHDDYHWLTAAGDVYMGTLLSVCPEIVLGRFVAVTSYDSGFLRLSERDAAAGWIAKDKIAYSPRIPSLDVLSFQRDGTDSPGYDEWYVFSEERKLNPVFEGNYFEFKPDAARILVFVNTFAFVLHDPEPYMPGILDRFWTQVTSIRPVAFIADGRDCLTVVCRDEVLVDTICSRLNALP
jgi:hypothetical protein